MSIGEMRQSHYNDVIMSAMASRITSPAIVYSTVYSGSDQRKLQCSTSLAFVRPFTGEFPAQKASNAENVSTWWSHHDTGNLFSHSPAYYWCDLIIFSWSPHVLREVTLHKTRFLSLAKILLTWEEGRKRILITYLLSWFFYHCKNSGVFKHLNT